MLTALEHCSRLFTDMLQCLLNLTPDQISKALLWIENVVMLVFFFNCWFSKVTLLLTWGCPYAQMFQLSKTNPFYLRVPKTFITQIAKNASYSLALPNLLLILVIFVSWIECQTHWSTAPKTNQGLLFVEQRNNYAKCSYHALGLILSLSRDVWY